MKPQKNQDSPLAYVLIEFSRGKVKRLTTLFCLLERADITKTSMLEQRSTC